MLSARQTLHCLGIEPTAERVLLGMANGLAQKVSFYLRPQRAGPCIHCGAASRRARHIQ